MSNSISVYSRVNDPMAFVERMGTAIAKSQMFGCDSESQGQVLALACLANRCDPLSIPQSFHLMHGRLTLRADAMLGRLSKAGGSYEIVEHSPHAAEIRVEYQGRKHHERFTWEDAQQEPFVYQGKPKDVLPKLLAGNRDKLQLSTNYATPRRRMQHLWARVVSDSVRVVAPELVTGVYSPDETHSILVEDGRVPANQPMDAPVADSEVEHVEVEDATFEVADATLGDGKATGEQIRELTALFTALKIPGDAQLNAMKKRGATDMGNLSTEGAADLIQALRAKRDAATEGPSKADPAATSAPNDGPCSETQINAIRSLLKQVAQTDGGVEVANKVRDTLVAKGLKLADLSHTEAATLEQALSTRNMQLFFDMQLRGSEKNDESQIPF